MDLWLKIGMAVMLGLMLIWYWPRAMHMIRNSPKAQKGDWATVVMVLGGVVAIVAFLMWSVRS